ncbi:HAD-IA family hydrolase [Nostoc sp. C117]|uniref:HAD-IA family hydrolase n=1 Tax=Nostoc sp. C117 TaxID=3349875 RepID=UPI00370D74C6
MLSAILFDLDGTLVDSEPLHYKAWCETLRNYGLEINEEFYKINIIGGINSQVIRNIFPSMSYEEREKFADQKETRFRQLAVEELKPLDGLSKLLMWTQKLGLKRAVVTNSPRKNAILTLEILGLSNFFNVVVVGGEAVAPKPHPAPYRQALDYLGMIPESTIAFEDSLTGISSSVGAGIYTIGVASSQSPDHLCQAGAKISIPDFNSQLLWELLDSSSRVSIRR